MSSRSMRNIDLRFARWTGSDWATEAALPLTAANDDETPPFPIAVTLPGSEPDLLAPTEPLVLYRVLDAGTGAPLGNRLRLVKGPGGVVVRY